MTKAAHITYPANGDLDPSDWDEFQAALQTVLDAAFSKFQTAEIGPVWTAPTDALRDQLSAPLPTQGTELAELTQRLVDLLPYGVGNTHPRFFGWVNGAGAPGNLLAEIIASAMNANCGGRNHAAILVERQVISWCKSLFEFPDAASGLIVSGTSMATIIAAKAARDAALGPDGRKTGLAGARLTGYTSEQAHSCLGRAFDMLGLGTDSLRKIPVTKDFEIDLGALADQIERDRADGFRPFFVSGNAGTVNTAAIDDLDRLASLSQSEKLWFHVDGAFAACAKTSATLAPRLRGIERADSLAFDFHKWMHVNYDAGCVLIRDEQAHRQAFAKRPDYLVSGGTALAGGEPWPVDFGPELSRCFRALKVWAHLLEHGTEKIGRSIEKNCAQAAHLGQLTNAHSNFELLAPVSLNICCLRYIAPDMTDDDLDELNNRIVERVQADGVAAPSTTRIHGKLAIRVNITNHRTETSDIEILFEALQATADRLLAERANA